MKIKILDSFVADKISAGEVIERPLSVVKELMENSIDAGASSITVEIRNGGKSYIRVSDDGSGIASDEVEIAFKRHATGKISTIDDLGAITTLGFRGEALASIAAVSRLTLYTKCTDERSGTKLVLHGGRKASLEEIGMDKGTTFVVEDIFYNTPARRKFMKSDAAEASAIIDMVQRLAIYYSDIRFKLINNGTSVITTPGDGKTFNAILSVYPMREYANLIHVYCNMDRYGYENEIKIEGYVSDPGTTRKSRRSHIFVVNGRIVSSDVIEKGIEGGYGDRVFEGYPIAIMFITVPPESIDVNIHPGKREIKFLKEKQIAEAVSKAIRDSIKGESGVPSAVHENRVSLGNYSIEEVKADHVSHDNISDQLDLVTYLEEKRENEDNYSDNFTEKLEDVILTNEEKEIAGRSFDFNKLKLAGYFFNTYILLQGEDAIFVLDQHAAHERINYEKLIDSYNTSEHLAQPILTPYTVKVSAALYNSDGGWIKTAERLGFEVEDFGVNTFLIRGIPEYMDMDEAVGFIRTFIDGVNESGEFETNMTDRPLNFEVVDKLIMKACKASVKANDSLNGQEISDLIVQLSRCRNPFSCPHGRPTFVKVTKYEVERAFKRK